MYFRWWKELGFATKLPFARDRLVEGYFWIVGVYFEPQYLWAIRILTKIIVMTTVIDDIYDAYGTLEEIKHFTEAIERFENVEITNLECPIICIYTYFNQGYVFYFQVGY